MEPILVGFVLGVGISFIIGLFHPITNRLYHNTVWFTIDPQYELTAERSLGAYKGLSIRCYPPSETRPSVVVITARLRRFGRKERTPKEYLENLMGILKAKEIRILDYGCY